MQKKHLFIIFLFLSVAFGVERPAWGMALSAGDYVPNSEIDSFDPEEMKGKPYAINFFATWCIPCRREQPALDLLAKAGVKIIGIAYRDRAHKVLSFLQIRSPYKDVFYDQRGVSSSFWDVSSIPETFLVDAKGQIRRRVSGPLSLKLAQQELLPLWSQINKGIKPIFR